MRVRPSKRKGGQHKHKSVKIARTSETMQEQEQEQEQPKQKPTMSAVEDQQKHNAKPKKNKIEKMIRRTTVSFILIGSAWLIVYLGHIFMAILVMVMQAACFYELINIRYRLEEEERKLPWFRSFHWLCFMTCSFVANGPSVLRWQVHSAPLIGYKHEWRVAVATFLLRYCQYIGFVLYGACIIMFVASLKKTFYKYQFKQLCWTSLVLVLVMLQTAWITDTIFAGFFWFILPASLVICNDTFAYFSGYMFGKRFFKQQLVEVSPNKTWEGFFGAFVMTVLWALAFSRVLPMNKYIVCPYDDLDCEVPEYYHLRQYALPPYITQLIEDSTGLYLTCSFRCLPVQLHAAVLAVFASFMAPFGGFLASGMKRAFKIKDFASLIPGHGGLMDRMDCQLVMAMVTHFHLITFVRPFVTTVANLMSSVEKLPDEQKLKFYRDLTRTLSSAGVLDTDLP